MKDIWISIRASLVLILLCGLLYNLAVTGVAQAVMPNQADGSLIADSNGRIVGSKLIGQKFTDPKYFHGRVSSIEYDAAASGTPNYAPSHPGMIVRTKKAIEDWQKANPDVPVSDLPIDLVTNSGSGLDPDISPAAAKAQIPRISRLTGIPAEELEQLVEQHTKGRALGFLGEPAVNVLLLNLDLQKKMAE